MVGLICQFKLNAKMNTKTFSTHREKILYTAFRLFLKKGSSVGINEIIKQAGISKGALYHHFPSKDTLYKEAITSHLFQEDLDYSFVRDAKLAFEEKVDKIIHTFFGNFIKNTAIFSESGAKTNSVFLLAEFIEKTNMRSILHQQFFDLHYAFYELFINHQAEIAQNNKNPPDVLASLSVKIVKGYYFDLIFFTIDNLTNKLKELKEEILNMLINSE